MRPLPLKHASFISDRRNLFTRAGMGFFAGALAAAAMTRTSTPAEAQTITDTAILNFTLNFEYIEAQYYLLGSVGTSLPAGDITGTGTQGTTTGGGLVPWKTPLFQQIAQNIAADETAHVLFLRAVLGSSAIAIPQIDFVNSFTQAALSAGLIQSGQTFNPFADEISFLLGAFLFNDIDITALVGAAPLLTSSTNIAAAAGLLGTEGYHAASVRTVLGAIGAGAATDAIANARATLAGAPDDGGTLQSNGNYNIVPADSNALAYARTPQQVLSIAYLGGTNGGGFFPNGVNGTITVA